MPIITTTGTGPDALWLSTPRDDRPLHERQAEHLRAVRGTRNDRPCMHDGCPECIGTGVRKDGAVCVHAMSCPCPKCSPTCMVAR